MSCLILRRARLFCSFGTTRRLCHNLVAMSTILQLVGLGYLVKAPSSTVGVRLYEKTLVCLTTVL